MKKYRKLKNRRSIKLSYIILVILFFIANNVFFLLSNFNKKVNPKLEQVINMNIDKMIENIITEYSLKEDYTTIKNILIINKNKYGEIINIDYDLPSLYNFSSHITDELKDDLYNLEKGKTTSEYYDDYLSSNNKDSFILNVPYGIASNNIFFSNLGPKIPVKVKFVGSILTGVKSKVTSYGINNSLIEVFTTINISTLIVTPVSKKRITRTYEVLVASKIIEGSIPQIYGGVLEKNSNITRQKLE